VNIIKNLAAESEDERGLALLMAVVFDDQSRNLESKATKEPIPTLNHTFWTARGIKM